MSDTATMDNVASDQIFIRIKPNKKKHNCSRLDLAMVISLFILGVFEITVNHLIQPENEYMTDRAKYWLGMVSPILTFSITTLKSVQLGRDSQANKIKNGQGKYQLGHVKQLEDSEYSEDETNGIVLNLSGLNDSTKVIQISPRSAASANSARGLPKLNFTTISSRERTDKLPSPTIQRKKKEFIMSRNQSENNLSVQPEVPDREEFKQKTVIPLLEMLKSYDGSRKNKEDESSL